jgi:hypothetical protein
VNGAAIGVAVSLAALAGAQGCEPKAVGRPCHLPADSPASASIFDPQALECPTRLCLRQGKDPALAQTVDTGPFCTAACSSDADCDDGETRDSDDRDDRRCRRGFLCGVAVQTGSVACCRKVCLCKDHLPAGGAPLPAACDRAHNPGICPLQP